MTNLSQTPTDVLNLVGFRAMELEVEGREGREPLAKVQDVDGAVVALGRLRTVNL